MDTSTLYSPKDWDDASDIPLLHMSYLLHILLPRRHFGLERLQVEKQKVIEGFLKIRPNCSDKLDIVPVGSKAEGYGIPDAVRLGDNPYIEYLSDIDAMMVRERFCVASTQHNADGAENKIFIETENTYPGYGRICYSSLTDVNSKVISQDTDTGKYYLNSSAIIQGQLDMLEDDSEDGMEVFRQGPAISSSDPMPMTLQRSKTDKIILPQDYVLAVSCESWPEVAKSWPSRKRSNGWLAADTIDSVITGGFHLVPVAHHLSQKPETEWRISFAKAEQSLSEQAVTAGQRQCYVFLKILRLQSMKEAKLSSYCLKNIFLYCCDELPVPAWDDDPAGCLLYMLDVAIECVKRGYIPSYFIPENNLISHLTEEELQTIESALQNIRSDPLSSILDFTDSRIFCFSKGECLSYSTTFRSIVQLVLDEIASIEDIDIGRTILGCFTDIQCNIASVMLGEMRSSFWYHLDFYKLFVQNHIQMPFVDFVNYMGIRLDSPFITLMFYEKCLAEVKSFPELEYIRGNMACMCFALALTHDDGSKERKLRLYQAEKIFKEVIEANGIHFPGTIDFANFLCYNDRWEEVIRLLEEFTKKEKKNPSLMQTGYYPSESTTLCKEIQREVKHTGCFLASSLSFAYYFLVKAYLKTHSQQLNKVLQTFKIHCQSVRGYGDFELFGYSCIETNNHTLAEMAFSEATTLTQNNHLAQVNLNLCSTKVKPLQQNSNSCWTPFKYILIMAYALDGNADKITNLIFSE